MLTIKVTMKATTKMDMDSFLECEVCFEHYDEAERRPRSLPCGHSVCHCCLVDNIATNAGYLTCPFCRISCSDTPVIAEDFPTNYTLLRISEKSLREAAVCPTASDQLKKLNSNLKRENKTTLKHIQSCHENFTFLKNYKSKLKAYKQSNEHALDELKWAFDQLTLSIEHMNAEFCQIEDVEVKGDNLREDLFNIQENLSDVTSMQSLESVCHGARKSYTATKRWAASIRKNLMDSEVIPACEKLSVSVQQRLRNLTSSSLSNTVTQDPLLSNTEDLGFVTSSPRPSRDSRNSLIITGIRENMMLNNARDILPNNTRESLSSIDTSNLILERESIENVVLSGARELIPIDSVNTVMTRDHRDGIAHVNTRISDTRDSINESREDDETVSIESISNDSTSQRVNICEEVNRERLNQVSIIENDEINQYNTSSMLMNMGDLIPGHENDSSNTQEQIQSSTILNESITSSVGDQLENQDISETLEPIDSVSRLNMSDGIDQLDSIADTTISVSPVPSLASANGEHSVNRERLVSILDEDDFDEEDILTEPEPLMWWKIESSDVSGAKPWWKDGPVSHLGSSLPAVPHLVPRWLEENRPTTRRSSEEGVSPSESEVRTLSPEVMQKNCRTYYYGATSNESNAENKSDKQDGYEILNQVLQVLAGSNGRNALWDIVVNATTRDMPVFAVRQASAGARQCANLTCYDGRLHLHALKEQDPPAHAITVPYEIVEKMSGKFLITAFLEVSWAREVRGTLYIQVRGDSRRGKGFLLLCCGKRGSSYTNMHLLRLYNHYRPGECVTTGDIENYEKNPVVLPKRLRFGTFRTAIKGGLVAGWASGEDQANPSKFCIYLRDQPGAEDAEAFGMVESGLEVLHHATSLSSISEAFVSSCGLVLSPDYT
ncbi:unnamed protein product [Meganyctiphanes norvegica]|uniref:RING-type domain-containing protein n=1 Tax=Meganyctiphanes norvegica TaxID=48144 RepID=A0AAV2QFX3_MEGNR